jgi:hypothetical protein
MDLKFYAKPATAQLFSVKRMTLFVLSVVLYTGIANAQPNNGIILNGTSNRVVVPTGPSLNISSALTIETWVKYTRAVGVQNVVAKSNNLAHNSYIFPRTENGWETVQFMVNLNALGWQVLEVPFSGSNHAFFDQWHHLAATFDGLVMSIYVDGVLAGSRSAVGAITVNNNPLWIGGQSGTSEYFRGKLDDVRLWRRALNQCEIASNKNCGLTGNETGLAAYYKFDQGNADGINPLQLVVDDSSPNNNDGQTNLSLTGLLTSNWTTGIVSGICPPLAPIEATVGSVESSVIGGSDIHLLAGGGDTYSWVGPNGFTSTEQNPVITNASSLNSGTYSVTITRNGCSVVLSTLILVTDWAKALFLDGQNDWVSVPNSSSLNFSNHLTIETWIYPTSHSPLVQNVVSKATEPGNSGYIFPRTDDGWQTVSFWLKINNQWQKVIVPFTGFSQWTHVAATYDGLFMKIFINGVEVGSLSAPGAISANTNNLSIGQQPGGLLSEYYKGGVDELRLWNRALSHCEIQNNMNCQLNGANNGLANQVDLVAYYRFNQGLVGANNTGITTLIDSSGHNNNGTLLNFTLTGTTSNWTAGSAINLATCSPYTGTLPSITGNGPVVEVGQTIELTASDGTAWSWTGPLGFTSNQQTIIIPNSTPDRSGVYTVNITGNGCTAPVSTKIKVAYKAGTLHFDGVDDQVVVPNSASVNISKTITLESWIKPTNSSRLIQSVLSKSTKKVNTGYIFPRTDDGWQNLTFYLHVNNAWEQMVVPYPALNEWHHVAATYDGYYMRIYIDGLLKGTKLIAAGGDITVNANDLMIGQQGGFTDQGIEEYFQGDLEEMRIWDRALSQCEIINNMNCEVGQLQNNGLAAYYKFNQGYVDADNTGITTLTDATPNANHGTLQQFTLDGLTSNWSTLKTTGTCATYAQPDVVASANGTVFAPGSIIRLFGTGGVTYTWDGPNNFVSTDNSPVINNVQLPNTGVYTVTAPFVNCVITASVRLVVSNLTPLITSGPTTFCPSGSVTISTENKGSAFQWLRDNVVIPNATDSFYVATESGSYSVSVTTAADVLVSEPVSVTVIDNEAPVVASLPTLHLETPATVAVAPTAFDNCAGTVTGTTQDPVHFEVPGTYNITWTYDDGNGNTSTQIQVVEVVWSPDVVAPELTIPANITRSNDNGICGAVVNFTATATDNRPGTVVITYSQDPGTIFPVGTTTVTVTATDEAGNIATGNFTVTVNDIEVPVLTLPANVNSNSSTGITVGTATATDNCGTPIVSHSTIPASFPLGITNITWTATDAAGNTVSGVQTVTVTDVTAPTLYGVPANTAVVCGNLPSVPVVTATDDFDANPAVVMTVTNNGNIITRTWTATDASGNSSSASQVITLIPDTEAPVMTAPANVTSTSGTGINIGTATATDNCSTPTISHNTLPASFPLGVTNVIWTATDAAGNTTTGIQTVTVSDVTAPVLVGVPANTTAPCGVVPAAANVTATDNFDASPVVTMTETTNGNIITRTWTATDASGNSSSASQTITVIPDTEAPVMTAPANVTSTSGTGINIGTATATDNCSTPTVSHSTVPASFPLGVTNVIWTATDAAGNTTTGIQTVTVSDVTAPVLVGVPANTTAPCGVVPAAAIVTATDNFDASPVVTMTETTNGNIITRTWTGTDASGNSSSAVQVITVVPPAAPVVSADDNCGSTTLTATGSNLLWSNNATGSSIVVTTPGTYTVTQTVNGCTSVPASVEANPTAIPAAPAVIVENNCGSTKLSTTAAGTINWSNNTSGSSITVSANGTYTVTTTVNGCTSAATEVQVTISANPVVEPIAGNTTITAGSTTQLTNNTANGTWNSNNNSIATVNANGLVSGVNAGTAVISYTVTSTAGCTTVVTATVTVNSNCVAPVITAANVVANTTSTSTNCTSPVAYTVNVTATPGATVTYTLNGATTGTGNGTGSGVVFNTGVTTVVVRATNSCGSTSATFTVTLRDGTSPVPNVTTLPIITGQCSVSLAATTSNNNNVCQDDCRCCRNSCHCRGNNGCRCRDWDYRYRGIVSLILYYLGGYGNWDDDDNHGCGDDDNSGPQTTNAPKATDNCKGVIVGTTTDPLTYTAQGTYTINWKFDDGNGNITIQQQTVIVRDDVKPVIDCPNNISVSCGSNTTPSGCNSTATATDNCGTPVVTYTDVTSGNVITRTWKATDAAGNFSTCEQTITVVDNTRPTISDISDRTVSCNASTAPSATGTPTASDNCGTPVVTYSDVTNGNVITRTWRATDAFGNYSTSTQKITTVADNTKPVISDVADKTVNCNASTAPSATGTATATDNCSTPVVTYNDVTSGNVITRTWKATDAAGNYSTSTQTITTGSAFTASVVSKPTNSTYTGGNDNNLYLGYGAQSTKLEVCTLPSSGAPYTYAWSGSSTNRLNSTSSSAPTFTPAAAGTYTYAVTVTNKFGCTSTDYITICVTDIRVPGTNGSKVYVCHKTSSKKNPYQTLQVSVNAVSAHLNHGCGNNDDDDRLGSCDQAPCNTSTVNAVVVSNQQGITAEGGSAVTTNSVVAGKTGVTTEEELKVIVMPNPSTTYFTLKFESRIDAPLDLRVMDGNGRVVDAKSRIGANSTMQIGHNYTSGTYYAEISQNGKRKVIQLIKVRG